ncbi:cytokine receptor family member b1 [Poecilia latipinna]|uniref:Interferon alpha/beta receptor 2-like n=1 Tax=Poecilia latipinna TaxID=48699 RepID=A0A3B3UQW5_9TELE|nr:PREDICTED: interferon alpha/beta receptor 2-like [Poecilia latipinna]
MNPFPLIFLILQLPSAVASLPAPVNLRIKSLNFKHVLRWDPGPGSPPGTQFRIYTNRREMKGNPVNSTSCELNLKNPEKNHVIAVEAFYNSTTSPRSTITFHPVADTVIGPPLLSVARWGTCIQGNISMPDLGRYTKAIHYDFSFTVLWRKGNDGEIQELEIYNRSFKLSNLEKDVEYCIQVLPKARVNENTQPSEWNCTFASISEPDYGLLVLVVVTAVLISSLIALVMGILCLCYTGFLCKLKKMPANLMVVLRHSYVLTLSTTDINRVTIIPQTVKTRNCPAMSPSPSGDASSEDEDGDEEAAVKLYMNRKGELSTGGGSADSSGKVDVMKGDFMEVESNQYEAKAETLFIYDKDQSGMEDSTTQQEEVKMETLEFSGDVNLFSVTLASIAACDEDEVEEDQDSGSSSMDFLRTYTLKPLSQMDSESKRDDGMRPSESGQDGSCTESWIDEEEEEEEEEEFSGYLTNK